MSDKPNGNTITVSFCNQPYPAYFGGYNVDIIERTAMALEHPEQLKRNVSNHLTLPENREIIQTTVRHFNHALACLAIGSWSTAKHVTSDRTPIQALDFETDVKEAMQARQLVNRESLVSVWGDFVLLVDDRYYWGSINKCDETTSAQMILDAVRVTFSALNLDSPDEALLYMPSIPKADVDQRRARLGGEQPKPVPQNDIPRTSKQVDTSHVAPNGDGKRKSETESAPAETPQPVSESDSGTPHFLKFPGSKTEKATFGAAYTGQIVSFEMQKVKRIFNSETGLPEYELYANSAFQWPSIKYIKPEYIKSKETQDWFSGIDGEQTGRWRVVCYVNVKGDNVYFNVNKVEPIVEDVPPEAVDMTPAQPKHTAQQQLPGTPPDQDIPF